MASTLPFLSAEELTDLESEIANTPADCSVDLDGLQKTILRDLIQAHKELQFVYAAFGIGRDVRKPEVLLANVQNSIRRNRCLSAIEREFFTVETPPDPDEDGDEPGEECLLRWGDDPAEYVERFRAELPAAAARGVMVARSTCALCGAAEPQDHKPECPTGQAERDLHAAYGVKVVDHQTFPGQTP